ncbi:MAG: CDF family Co(II)/Ni(II) efflux transporter DmeF [Gammaproteobacteria bacterium]
MHHEHLSAWQHDHSFGQENVRAGERRTWIVIGLTWAMMMWEILAGIAYGSMALLADGLHMGSHATALGITAFAYVYARRHAYDRRFSFGTGKVNALGGFTGAVLLAGFALVMAAQSIERLFNPVEIAFNSAILVAVIGLIVNGACAWILKDDEHGHAHDAAHPHDHAARGHQDHNLRSAYLHVLADALTSLLAIFALLAAKYFGLNWMDPVMGIVGAVLITRWSWGLLRAAGGVLLDRQAPDELCGDIRDAVEADRDTSIGDLHVWAIGPDLHAAIVSVIADDPQPADYYKRRIARRRSLAHVTVEVQQCSGSKPA